MSEPADAKNFLSGLRVCDVLKLKLAEDLRVSHGSSTGSYSGWITDGEGRALFSTCAVFETPKAAEDFMREVIKAAHDYTPVQQHMKKPEYKNLRVAQKIGEVLNHVGGAPLSPEAAALLRLAVKVCHTGKRPSQEMIDRAVDDEYMKLGKSGPVHSRYKIWKEHVVQVSRNVQAKAAALGVTHGEFEHALRCPAPSGRRGVYYTCTHASGRFRAFRCRDQCG